MQVPWVICFLFVFFNRGAECTNCSAIKVPDGKLKYWLDQTIDVTWNTIPNATYTITACCLIRDEGRPGCLNVHACPTYTRLNKCHNGPKKSTRTCVVSGFTPWDVTVRVTLSINVPGCPTKSNNISLYTRWEEIRAKPVHGLSLDIQSDGMLAKWSHKKAGVLCYFYKAVEVLSEKVIKEDEIKTESVKVALLPDMHHGYRQIKFCVKLRYCRNGRVGKMSEETCELKRTLPGAPSESVNMLCDGSRGSNPCPVVKNERERNITLLWELPEKRFWNGNLTKIEIINNNTVYTTINATRANYTLRGLKLHEDYHIQLKLFSHSGEGRITEPILFSKEKKVLSPGPDITEGEVDSALLIIIVAASLVVAITVALVFTCLTIRSKRKQKSPLPNIQMPREGEAHSGTDPNLRTNPANYESLPDSEDGLGDKSSIEKLSYNSSENDSITCPLVANTRNGACRNDAPCYPKETCI